MKTHISILETEMDGIKNVRFYIIYNNNVIADSKIAYPYTKDAYFMDAFVTEKYRRKGLWKKLYDARHKWILKNCPVKCLRLYVDNKNPMKAVYERYGYSTYKIKGKISKTRDGYLWMYKKVQR